jgi:hypothetical protein
MRFAQGLGYDGFTAVPSALREELTPRSKGPLGLVRWDIEHGSNSELLLRRARQVSDLALEHRIYVAGERSGCSSVARGAMMRASRGCWAKEGPRRQHYEPVRWGNRPGKSPAASLKALYGYASNTPGARNAAIPTRRTVMMGPWVPPPTSRAPAVPNNVGNTGPHSAGSHTEYRPQWPADGRPSPTPWMGGWGRSVCPGSTNRAKTSQPRETWR